MDSVPVPSLPEETLDQIFAYLQIARHDLYDKYDHENRATIRAACRVSKTFYRLAVPRLYHTIIVSRTGAELPHLLWALLNRPDYAKFVKCLRLHDGKEFQHGDGDNEPTLIELARDKRIRQVKANLVRRDHWIHLGVSDKAMLLALCTSIRRLALAFQSHPSSHARDLLTLLKSRHDKYLNLKEICVADSRSEGSLAHLASLFQFPSLDTFIGQYLHSGGSMIDTENILGNLTTSNVTKVELWQSAFGAEGIATLLVACPRLKSLLITWPTELTPYGDDLDFDAMGEVLRARGTALEDFDLKAQNAWFSSSRIDPPSPLGDLSSLSSLRLLAVPATAFFEVDDSEDDYCRSILEDFVMSLPKSLKKLKIYDAFDEYEEHENNELAVQLSQLMSDNSFTALSEIILENESDRVVAKPTFDQNTLPLGWTSTMIPAGDDGAEDDWVVDYTVLERNIGRQSSHA